MQLFKKNEIYLFKITFKYPVELSAFCKKILFIGNKDILKNIYFLILDNIYNIYCKK